jgi:hypothetical protein
MAMNGPATPRRGTVRSCLMADRRGTVNGRPVSVRNRPLIVRLKRAKGHLKTGANGLAILFRNGEVSRYKATAATPQSAFIMSSSLLLLRNRR